MKVMIYTEKSDKCADYDYLKCSKNLCNTSRLVFCKFWTDIIAPGNMESGT